MRRFQLGSILLDKGIITQEQLASALQYMRDFGLRLGQALVLQGACSEEDIADALAGQFGLERICLTGHQVDVKSLGRLGKRNVQRFQVIPLSLRTEGPKEVLAIATAHPENMVLLDDLRAATGVCIEVKVATESEIADLMRQITGRQTTQSTKRMTALDLAFNQFARGNSQTLLIEEDERPRIIDVFRELAPGDMDHVFSVPHRIHVLDHYDSISPALMEKFLQGALTEDQLKHCHVFGGIAAKYHFPGIGLFRITVENYRPPEAPEPKVKGFVYRLRIDRLAASASIKG